MIGGRPARVRRHAVRHDIARRSPASPRTKAEAVTGRIRVPGPGPVLAHQHAATKGDSNNAALDAPAAD